MKNRHRSLLLQYFIHMNLLCPRRKGALSDTDIRPSVCLMAQLL